MKHPPAGYTVKFYHEREFTLDKVTPLTPGHVKKEGDVAAIARYRLSPTGGLTQAILYDESETPRATGFAICSPSDNFVKAVGRSIALERAIHALESEQARVLVRNREMLMEAERSDVGTSPVLDETYALGEIHDAE